MNVVVSLTATPPCFSLVGRALKAILNQSVRPDSIELTIPRPYHRFPEHSFAFLSFPKVLL